VLDIAARVAAEQGIVASAAPGERHWLLRSTTTVIDFAGDISR
jgi:hypothetical protein